MVLMGICMVLRVSDSGSADRLFSQTCTVLMGICIVLMGICIVLREFWQRRQIILAHLQLPQRAQVADGLRDTTQRHQQIRYRKAMGVVLQFLKSSFSCVRRKKWAGVAGVRAGVRFSPDSHWQRLTPVRSNERVRFRHVRECEKGQVPGPAHQPAGGGGGVGFH